MSKQICNTTPVKERFRSKKDNNNKLNPKSIYSCKYCESEFTQKTNLYRHIRHLHKRKGNASVIREIKLSPVGKLTCATCKEEFPTQSLFSFHQALLHPARKGKVVITCSLCNFSGSKGDLLGHFVSQHNVKIEIEEHNFPRALDFYVWKSNLERDTLTQYAKRQKHHVLVNGVIIDMLYCHRDGFYKPEGRNLRNVKMKGTNKINGYCPAFMKVMTYGDDRVSVLFLKTHVGHDYELDRLTLTREERDYIAGKIAVGIPFDDILADLHTSKHERLRIMTRKDLYNIEASYHLSSIRSRYKKSENVLQQHYAALKVPQEFVVPKNNRWCIKSTSNSDTIYTVETVSYDCDVSKCILRCKLCKCCAHNYKCSCENNLELSTMCKHKHLVHITKKDPQIIKQDNHQINIECNNDNDVILGDQMSTSSITGPLTDSNLVSPIMLDNCPQLTTLVIQDLPPTIDNETATMFVPTNDINDRKVVIRNQLAGILQAVESSEIEEELHIIQSLLEPIVQTVQTMKDPEVEVQPACKQLRLDNEGAQYFTTTSVEGSSIISANQLQPSVVDDHNNSILITYTLNQPSQ